MKWYPSCTSFIYENWLYNCSNIEFTNCKSQASRNLRSKTVLDWNLDSLFEQVRSWFDLWSLNKVCSTQSTLQLLFRVKPWKGDRNYNYILVNIASWKGLKVYFKYLEAYLDQLIIIKPNSFVILCWSRLLRWSNIKHLSYPHEQLKSHI
jgi:hypothetical protein